MSQPTDDFEVLDGVLEPEPEPESRPEPAARRSALGTALLALACFAVTAGGVTLYREQAGLEDELRAQQAVVAALSSRLEREQEERVALERRVASTRSDIAQTRNQVLQTQTDVAKTRDDVARTRTEIDAVKNDFAASRVDVPGLVARAEGSIVTVHCADSIGTGFAVTATAPAGYRTGLLTNFHVVEGCAGEGTPAVTVTKGAATYGAVLTRWDETNDLALVHVDAALPVLEPAAAPAVGNPVVAIGSPYGLEGTVTTGVVSKVHPDVLQTDAAVNPGNSGGPLLDREGRVLGVTTFQLDGAQGLNFAVRLGLACGIVLEDCPSG